MGFDADAYVRAREPWTLTIGGRTYPARPVSVPAVLQFYQTVQDIQEGKGGSVDTLLAEKRRLLRSAFPWRPSFLWRGDPVAQVLALDLDAQRAVLDDFFEYVGRWVQHRKTSGIVSLHRTPPQAPGSAAA